MFQIRMKILELLDASDEEEEVPSKTAKMEVGL